MTSFALPLRLLILVSLLLSVASALFAVDVCYTCEGGTLATVVALHLLLFLATFANNQPMQALVFTLLVFYASRLWILAFDMNFYTYPESTPTPGEMGEVMLVLLGIAGFMLAGCAAGSRVGAIDRNRQVDHILPLAGRVDERRYLHVVMAIFILSRVLMLYLFVTTGIGLPIARDLFDLSSLQIAKAANAVTIFSMVPVAWFILRKPKGLEAGVTLAAIVLFALVQMISLSKVAIATIIVPFLLVYYTAGIKPPAALLRRTAVVMIAIAMFLSTAISDLRTTATDAFLGYGFQLPAFSANVGTNVLGFTSRLGSSFDVLSFAVLNRELFAPYLSVSDELKEVVNGFIPGQLVAANPPRWNELTYAIGHRADYEFQLKVKTGENITLPAYLYVNCGPFISCVLAFVVMFLHAFAYRYAKSIVERMFLLSSIIFGISNSSGLVAMLADYMGLYLYFGLSLAVCHLIFAPVASRVRPQLTRAPTLLRKPVAPASIGRGR